MSTGEFRHDLLTKWGKRRNAIRLVLEQAQPSIKIITEHLKDLADILHEATSESVVFDTYDRIYDARENSIAQKFKLESASHKSPCEIDISFWGNALAFGGTSFPYNSIDTAKENLNDYVLRHFLPPDVMDLDIGVDDAE